MSITNMLIIVTCIISIFAFMNPAVMQRLVFTPYTIHRNKEWFRFFTSGFLHANWLHLFFNMYVLFLFGNLTELYFKAYFGEAGIILYLIMYLLGVILAETYSFFQHKNNPGYASLGASGAVSSVIFASIMFEPLNKIGIIFFPIGMPGFVFGLLYLLYSWYMAREGRDNIGHYAHFFGAVFGFIFPALLRPALFLNFFHQIVNVF